MAKQVIASSDTLATALTTKANANFDELYQSTRDVQALTDGATITPSASLGNYWRVTLGGNRTLANPTGTPYDGQKILLEAIQDATGSRTLTLGNKYAFGTDITALTLTTTASKRDFIGIVYNATADKWYIVAVSKGY